ncbi:orotate phosphoribosyltransferase [Hippea maritima]|uniref:Orotate phosphoribosyltransferase n=1 Tax=Hippea maritima (strain ATCC 700847 / DSM 10411 / MH2) TaxID=760142 RepID=F2LY77_HIPMA|nr:orotate phosphoribosyltransferase [Hippea maritima]AEA34400.1 orotate phosphoribosyltransferase [Hippea maritima DSM 10411]
MLTQDEALKLYKKRNAYLQGHFLLSSGLHSEFYLQSALVLQYPHDAWLLCSSIAEHFKDKEIDVVIAPAMGGILVSYDVARALGENIRSIFAERVDGKLTLRRGFSIDKNERVLVVEDVVTTGKSVRETLDVVKQYTNNIIGIGALVDRGGNFDPEDLDYFPLIKLNIENYEPDNCPLCKKGIPLEKPGSRFIKK